MRPCFGIRVVLFGLILGGAPLTNAGRALAGDGSAPRATQLAQAAGGPSVVVDVNRPRTPFDCDLPIGIEWYGSRSTCLQYLCGGKNVYNEYIFDQDNRRRKNPCFGQSPTDFGEKFD
jgi:hypothetical protein